MIELLLQAERSLAVGLLDQAEHIYWQAIERDPQNGIAVVGLARVALERGDDRTSYAFARRALEIDGENATARRLVARLEEVMRHRGEPTPEIDATRPIQQPETTSGSESRPEPASAPEPGLEPASTAESAPEPAPGPAPGTASTAAASHGLVDRLLRRR